MTGKNKRKQGCRSNYDTGFTLLELLVVIAIISLLVSILLPSLNKAKLLARSVVCASKLKSFGSALMLYANNYDGRLIEAAQTDVPPGEDVEMRLWYMKLYRDYLDSQDAALECPEQKFTWDPTATIANKKIGYGWNYLNYGHTSQYETIYGYGSTLTSIPNPGEAAIIGDNLDVIDMGTPLWSYEYQLIYLYVNVQARRHNNGLNLLFLDGSAKWFRADYVFDNYETIYMRSDLPIPSWLPPYMQ